MRGSTVYTLFSVLHDNDYMQTLSESQSLLHTLSHTHAVSHTNSVSYMQTLSESISQSHIGYSDTHTQ